MEKLSSGYRINRAADDAAGLAISEKMRGQIGGLAQAQRNAQDGISLVQTAEGALNEVHSMLQRVRDLKVQYDNGTLDDRRQGRDRRRGLAARQGDHGHRRPRRSSTAQTLLSAAATFTFQVGANDGETIALDRDRAVGADRPPAAWPSCTTSPTSAARRGRARRRGGALDASTTIDDGDQERLDGRVPTSARSRTASSTA